jgi:NitT/TauT family transport system substrate-binding protein
MRSGIRIALVLALALAMCVPTASQQLETIVVAGPPSEPMKTVYYAQRAGLFRKLGIDVQISLVNSGSAAMAAVAGGSVDLAHASILSVFLAHDRGVQFTIVGPSGLYLSERPQAILIVKKDSPVRSGHDLDGAVIASSALKDLNAVATLAWIDAHGGDSKTVRVIELTNSAIIPAIADGRIAAATVTAPYKDIAIQTGVARLLGKSMDAIAPRFQISGYIGSAATVERRKDAMHRFAQALHESILYTNAHPAEMVDLIASYTGMSADALRKTDRTVDPEFAEPRYIQPFIDFAAKYGLIEHGFDAREVISDVAVKPAR